MLTTLQAFGFVGLGMLLSHVYNWMAWRKYYEGLGELRGDERGRR